MLLILATHYRALYLYSVQAHHLAAKVAFHQDHAFFNEVYDLAEKFYDEVVERHIGLNGEEQLDLILITQKSLEILHQVKTKDFSDDKEIYVEILKQIKAIMPLLDKYTKDPSVGAGCQNMTAGQADELEVLIYKISRRIK